MFSFVFVFFNYELVGNVGSSFGVVMLGFLYFFKYSIQTIENFQMRLASGYLLVGQAD